jgi:predicted DNA-binding transcriptional regulator AlpA
VPVNPGTGETQMDWKPQKIFRRKDLPPVTGYQKSQLDELIKAGKFPSGFPLSDGGRARGWFESDIVAWQLARRAARNRTA